MWVGRSEGGCLGLDRLLGSRPQGPARRVPGKVRDCRLKKNVLGQDLAFGTDKYAGPLDHVSQFADIAWPVVAAQSLSRSQHSGWRQGRTWPEKFRRAFQCLQDARARAAA